MTLLSTIIRSEGRVVIDGLSLDLDEIVNPSFLETRRINELREAYLAAKPFPHCIMENFFSPRLLDLLHTDFERLSWGDWQRYSNADEIKRGSVPYAQLGHASQLYFNTLYSGRIVDFIERVTGMRGLVPDPALHSGGLHEVPSGGKFSFHIDFNQHSVTGLQTGLVFITYLNKDWRASYGGALELWDKEKGASTVSVLPEFGRTIFFSGRNMHGHPSPVTAPNGASRRSVAAYLYHARREDEAFHTTRFAPIAAPTLRRNLVNMARYCLPPVLVDGARFLLRPRRS